MIHKIIQALPGQAGIAGFDRVAQFVERAQLAQGNSLKNPNT